MLSLRCTTVLKVFGIFICKKQTPRRNENAVNITLFESFDIFIKLICKPQKDIYEKQIS